MTTFEVHFENLKEVLTSELSKAQSTVHIAVAWINFNTYFNIIKDLLDKKVKVNIVCSDNWQNRSHLNKIEELEKSGAEITMLKMPSIKNHMHHKFVLIDGTTIINGSFNWSPNAESSFENLMIIRGTHGEVQKFKEEFDRLITIETRTIKQLQKVTKCGISGCSGNLFNILIFSERRTQYYETYGDIVSVCSDCNEYHKVQECIPNNQLPILLDEVNGYHDDYELELIEKHIVSELQSYQDNDITIHAIGRVQTALDGFDNEWTTTKILWKNRFVGDKIPDGYDDEDFDVSY